MALTAEDKKEIQQIINISFKSKDIDISLMQQQWKKFKETPEARLAALEVKVDDLTYEFREFKKEINGSIHRLEHEMKEGFEKIEQKFEKIEQKFEKIEQKFEKIEQKFGEMNKTIIDLHKAINNQVWKFIGSLGFILILLKLVGALFP